MLLIPGRRVRSSAPLAVDLGTARTRVWAPEAGLLLDEPTLVAVDFTGVVAAGRQAWECSAATSARLRFPVRAALAVDPIDCVRFLQVLFEQERLEPAGPVVLSVPAAASPYEASILSAVVSSVVGNRVTPVDSLLAAGIGIGLPVDEPAAGIVCDVGAGVLEIGVIGDGRLRGRACAVTGTRDYLDDPGRLLAPAQAALRRALDEVPAVVAGDVAAGPVHLVGGGALVPGLATDLAGALHADVVVADEPRTAGIRGLARCMETALVA